MEPNFIMLYVDSPAKSADFYTRLFGKKPVEASPTFALFILDSGIKFGLWSKHTVEPAAQMTGGGGEVAFSVVDSEQVDDTYSRWVKQGLSIAQSRCKWISVIPLWPWIPITIGYVSIQ
ncbi:VOC family protein [Edaphovirga cremea]|uniref:VOC family protein n=1 Tax=Edaphovirga cremea TaxID=2267246 RepID=UPI003988EC59